MLPVQARLSWHPRRVGHRDAVHDVRVGRGLPVELPRLSIGLMHRVLAFRNVPVLLHLEVQQIVEIVEGVGLVGRGDLGEFDPGHEVGLLPVLLGHVLGVPELTELRK